MRKQNLLLILLTILTLSATTILSGCNDSKEKETASNIATNEKETTTKKSTQTETTTKKPAQTETTTKKPTQTETTTKKPTQTVTETLTGTKWWDGDQSSKDYTLSGDGYIVFDIYISSKNNKDTNAYCVEAYDNAGHYITTTSDATAWYAGTTGTISSAVSNGPAVPGQTVRVIFTRFGNTYTFEYLDAQTEEYIFDKITATEDGNLQKELKLHVMAQIGTFEVTMIETGEGEYSKKTADTDSIIIEGLTKLDPDAETHIAPSRKRVSVHDPSIVIAYINESIYTGKEKLYPTQNDNNTRNKVYFIFGTCLSNAYSNDLENWISFETNLNKDHETILAHEKAWAIAGSSDYSLFWHTWAPDVIWNPYYVNDDGSKGAWMMYVSINGAAFNSAIALLTTTDLQGDWIHRGTVIYSGFSEKGTTFDYTKTDYLKYAKLDNDGTLPDRYVIPEYYTSVSNVANTWNKYYAGHAIDPNIFFDEEGILRFTYGSFAGGIYMLEIDPSTGFRNDRVYELDTNHKDGTASDPYCGIRIAGGNDVSVEGAYIKYLNGRYYLFLSVGGCYTYTGYNMRVFSSANVEGEYTDYLGNSAFDAGPIDGGAGGRLMFNYHLSWKKLAQLAQGHNSVYIDDNGNLFLIYHEKTNNGTDYNTAQVHQMFVTTNGAIVVAPFEYTHTDEVDKTYSDKEIVGTYDIILHKTTDFGNHKSNTAVTITLNADHTISGAKSGTWKLDNNSQKVILTIDRTEYHGRFLKQTMEGTDIETLCFTTISQSKVTDALWGYKIPSDKDCVQLAINTLPSLDKTLTNGTKLSTAGPCGTTITWYCDSNCISKDGVVTSGKKDETVTVYVVVSKGDYYSVRAYINRVIKAK